MLSRWDGAFNFRIYSSGMKALVYSLIFIGGLIGAYIPVWFWHVGALSGWSIIFGGIGSFAGLWAAIKLNSYFS